MNYIGKVLNNCKYIYNEINAATLTGAIDVVVVEQPDGTFTCSPFHVRFGKLGVLRSKEKIVDIEINGEPVDIHMKLGESGEAFFVEEVEFDEDEDQIPPHLACSPIPPDHFVQEWASFERSDSLASPKTFRAETEEEEINRKLGSTARDFRPIAGQPSETSLSSQESEFFKEDAPSADERIVSHAVNAATTSKKKRRKKSMRKKNGRTNGNGRPQIDESSEDIFLIENLDSEPVPTPSIPEKDEKGVDVPMMPAQVERDIHFFSDTEITPGSRFVKEGKTDLGDGFQLLNGTEIIKAFPRESNDFAPVQSDTEFENSKRAQSDGGSASVTSSQDQPKSWRWGELPTSSPIDGKHESQKWILHNMLGFMKKTKHIRHKNESADGGIYLSDLNSDDPEMAALYFPSAYHQSDGPPTELNVSEGREEDAESGNGPSLPQSPHSVEGAICGPKDLDHLFDNDELALSLCGANATPEQFNEFMVSHAHFSADPQAILNNPKLTVRIDRKLYPWKFAAPIILSMAIYNKPLPQDVLNRLCIAETEEGESKSLASDKPKKPYSSWFNWSRANANQPQPTFVDGPTEPEKTDCKTDLNPDETLTRPDSIEVTTILSQDAPLDLTTQPRTDKFDEGLDILPNNELRTPDFSSDKYRKTLRLSSQQIACLNLLPGANEVEFSVTTAYQGTSKCKCFLFCWRYDDKIVVSDIDGTITKSDVLGHILPIVGKDWAQSGVAKLFTKIKDNGYKLLYLSARAIGQSRVTRDYLKSIKQEDLGLPEGPMLLNPTSLLNAFHTEVIEKKPEEFKISCLKDIQALFPSNIKPFYAGYGNKINDVWAYQAVGIPIFRIFTINHRGELKHELTQTFQSTYIGQSCIVNDLFPPVSRETESETEYAVNSLSGKRSFGGAALMEIHSIFVVNNSYMYTNMTQLVDQMFPANNLSSEDFSQFVYWREPIADIPLIDIKTKE